MGKLIGPDFVSLQVRDLEAAKQFYMKYLGLTLADRSPPGAVVFNTTPVPFAIRKPIAELPRNEKVGTGISLWLACDNADEFFRQMTIEGLKILAPPQEGPFGRFFTFEDMDGYAITLHTLVTLHQNG